MIILQWGYGCCTRNTVGASCAVYSLAPVLLWKLCFDSCIATHRQSPFAVLSVSLPCYRNGYFASWFYSSVFCNSSLSDTELGFGMMRVLSPILWCQSSFGLMPLLVSCTFVTCHSSCINVHAPPSSADTAVRSDFPLRFSRHTATAVPQSLHTDCILAYNLCSIVLPRLFLNWVIWKPLIFTMQR